MRILVLGGDGYLGWPTAMYFSARGHDVAIADIIGGSGYARTFIDPRPGEVKESLADISKAKKLLKWKPEVSFKKGIELLKIE